MKILFTSDLHIQYKNSEQLDELKKLRRENAIDMILIAGDVFESNISNRFNPYEELAKLDCKVVCCLGNHEFAYRPIKNVKNLYTSLYDPNKYDVHYLDIVGSYETKIDGTSLNVVGNVLWYDGSLSDVIGQSKDSIDKRWLDSTILDFDFKNECEKCKNQIKEGYVSTADRHILLTHTVPERVLNEFSNDGTGWPNMYSGISNFLDELNSFDMYFDYVFCGHTHRFSQRNIRDQICVNIGNDYFFNSHRIEHMIVEL